MDVVPETTCAEFLADRSAHAACDGCHNGQSARAMK